MDADARGQPPSYRTLSSHTGAEFEGNTVTNRNSGERVPGVEPVNAREPEPQRRSQARADGITAFFSRPREEDVELVGAAGRKRPKKVAASKVINVKGKPLTIYQGTSAVEDEAWVVITEFKPNGNKVYMCMICTQTWAGAEDRVVSHFLRIKGQGVNICTRQPGERCRDVCERIKSAKDNDERSATEDYETREAPGARRRRGDWRYPRY